MKRFYIKPMYWRRPLPTHHKTRRHTLLVRAIGGDGSSPGWHLWLYTYPKGVQHGRLLCIMGRWVSKKVPRGTSR